jgi:AcrR family transcriptional regulator
MANKKLINVRKRPRQTRSADTVNVIVEAAAWILENEGFPGYNTNAIAARAGVSVGSIYQYFPNKDALTATLIERETHILLEDVEAAIKISDCRESLTSIIAACVAHQTRRPTLARLLDIEEARLPLQRQNKQVTDKLQRAIMACVEDTPAAKALGTVVVAFDLFAMVRGIADAAGERNDTKSDQLRARVERAVFGYLEHEAPPLKSSRRPVKQRAKSIRR